MYVAFGNGLCLFVEDEEALADLIAEFGEPISVKTEAELWR